MRRLFTILFSTALLLALGSAQGTWAQNVKFYDLGHYPGGTWAELWGINKAGVLVGTGDIPDGYARPIGVPLFGPEAGEWFDLGTLGGDRTDAVMCMAIADTGMIVGHAAIADNETIHAFVWTAATGKVDLGTLKDIGYPGYTYSLAWGTNRSGTLIVGFSANGLDTNELSNGTVKDALPVVWTPKVKWDSGQWKVKWQIHKLDTRGFHNFHFWVAMVPNDSGQIVGTATGADGTVIGVLWNPVNGGQEWKIQKLPTIQGYSSVWPYDINNRGEIVGDVLNGNGLTYTWTDEFPAYWKPTDSSGEYFRVTILPTLGGYLTGMGDAEGINDVGDIVGGSTDANGNYYATAWRTKDLDAVPRLLPTPLGTDSWSWANRVNDYGIAVGSYGNDDVQENAAAWKLR
jgi:probable HAF family extracellular repeat protein